MFNLVFGESVGDWGAGNMHSDLYSNDLFRHRSTFAAFKTVIHRVDR